MSFQGDVRGIGLAELLQGLARGRKEGVLTLTSKEGLRTNLGLDGGRAYLLAEDGEDPERWRARVRDAWCEESDSRVDHLRMSQVARAERMEQLYGLLDGGGVHFRFEPGEIPGLRDPDASKQPEGTQVEFLLLEYARIADELAGAEGAMELPDDAVPCLLDPGQAAGTPPRFLENCNGASTLREIADRLGWPLRQAKLTVVPGVRVGGLRLAHPSEMLRLALGELARKNFSRAALRLAAWARDGQPGPVAPDEAEALANEWVAGRLTAALKGMPSHRVRTLLRRLDWALGNLSQSVVHWTEACRLDKTDRIARMRRMVTEFREGSNPERPSVRELLDLSREYRDAGNPGRSGPLLVIAANLQPEAVGLRLELGLGLVAAGRAEEGSPWVLAGARALLDAGQPDRAVGPLRSLLSADSRNRDCRQLLSRARRSSTHARKLRKHLLVSLAIVSVFSLAAIVKLRSEQRFYSKLSEVRALIAEPQLALAKLRQNFPDDDSPEVLALAEEIEDRERLKEIALRNAWLDLYSEALVECSKGDPIQGFELALTLPQPPQLRLIREPWPLRRDLHLSIAQHLAQELALLGVPIEGSPQQVQREDHVADQVLAVLAMVSEEERSAEASAEFIEAMQGVLERVDERRTQRDGIIGERLRRENLEEQERLYLMAEAHAGNGDFERALRLYDDILETADDPRMGEVLAPRIAEVRKKHEAVLQARKLAREGRHTEAWKVLQESFDEPEAFMLPWKVDTFPSGARVELTSGRSYRTPFEVESTFGEHFGMSFSLEGFEPVERTIDRPGDIFLNLSRVPERSWASVGRIDAAPVAVDGDHIVVDRKGSVVRVGEGGEVRWQQTIEDLSGIARAPVFMPELPGTMLLVTEGGAAWILDSESGKLDGPHDLGSPPLLGPAPNSGHVRVRLADGRLAIWRDGLRPVLEDRGAQGVEVGLGEDFRYGSSAGLQILRSREGGDGRLACRWNDWVVEVHDDVFRVFLSSDPAGGYSIVRAGAWEYLAWESATARAPNGRLWVSDDSGIRAFEP